MQTVSSAKVPGGYERISLDFIREHDLDNVAIEVVDDNPDSLVLELFGHPNDTYYMVPDGTYINIINKLYPPEELSDDDLKSWAGV